MRIFVLALFLLTGCATTATRAWVDDARLKFDGSKYPDDAAVILYRKDKTTLEEDGSAAITRNEKHEVIAVRGEAGFWLAEVMVPHRAQDQVTGFRARIIQPDGSRQEFEARDFLSDVSAKGERQLNAYFFRFPGVRVGSILEYWWVVEGDGWWNADEQETLGEFPVKLYEFELTAAKPLVVETIEWNGASPIQVRSLASGEHQLLFSLVDLPRREKVDFAPHFSFTEPRWAWRVLAYRQRTISWDWLRDWKDVVERNATRFFTDPDVTKGFEHTLDLANCDATCLVKRAQEFVFTRTEPITKWDRAEPLAATLASGKASIVERALMLRLLLERAGLDVWLAYGTDALSQQVAAGFPRMGQFNHLFVYLPAQKGLMSAVTIDPDCEFCAPGELTTRHRDQRIYVFRTEKQVSRVATEGRWDTAFGTPAPISERRFTHRAQVEADGSITDEVVTATTGLEASGPANDFLHRESKLERREVGAWAQSNANKSLQGSWWGDCKRSLGKCSWTSKLSFPGQAWKSDAGWTVQLGFLNAIHSELFDAEQRELDVHFARDEFAVVEVLELAAPAGTRLVSVPEAVNVNAGSLRASVTVERTPAGARLTRRLDRSLGFEPKVRYDDLRSAADAFKRARQLVLNFAPAPK